MREYRLAWGADFETTVEIQYLAEGRVYVWAWAVQCVQDPDTKARGETIESFFEFFKNKKADIYFHNLKFDGMFILDYLLRSGYPAMEFTFKDKPKEPHVETMIDGHGAVYRIDLYDGKTHLAFYDSMKKYRMPLESVASIFRIPGKTPLKLGYRFIGREVTDEEWERVENDVGILCEAMRFQKEQGLNRITVASDAKDAYVEMTGKEVIARRHPRLSYELDEALRPAYKGGYVYLNEPYRGKVIHDVWVFDENSKYPAIMKGVHGELLPRGMPRWVDQDYVLEENEVDIWDVTLDLHLKKNKLPWIHYNNHPGHLNVEYIIEEEDPMRMMFATPDWELLHECYECDVIGFNGRWVFWAEKGQFDSYVNYWMGVKERASLEGNGGRRQQAKDMMNNLSGRFALNPNRESKVPYFDKEADMVKFQTVKKIVAPWYVPTSIFITSYGRNRIVHDAMRFGDDFVYADTDSLHILNYEKHKHWFEKECHPTHLGYYGLEDKWEDAKYIRAKAYMHQHPIPPEATPEQIRKLREVKCGGLPDKAKEHVNFDNFHVGSELEGKLAGRVVPGGYLLRDTTFKIQGGERWTF